jgi:predicted DNA-binding transcriptional regulator YafY
LKWSPDDHFWREDVGMRADRLVATLLVLQAKGRVTAAELAEELEVSVKTARRDLEALAIAGIPVYSQPGKGGGWSLLGGARTDLSGLTADEARTLFLVAGPSSTATPEAKAALRKLVQALPETFRAGAEAAAAAVVLDPAGWGGTARPRPVHLDELQRAVVDGVQVRLGYADRTRSETERVVHPLGLVEKDSIWYLVADTANGMRTFRVNRVRSVSPTGEPVVRPPGFDLAATWESVVETMEERRTSLRAVVVVAPPGQYGLREQFGPRTTVRRTLDDGRVEVEIGAQTPGMIAERLAGWGAMVDVVEPAEVRDELARIGRQLVERYDATAAGQPA